MWRPRRWRAFSQRLRSGEFAGGNVTIPHKEAVFALCDSVDPLATTIGAVNTLIVDKRPRSTAPIPIISAFSAISMPKRPAGPMGLDEAIVLGAGGAARAVLVALRSRGVETIHILNRTRDKAEALAGEIEGPFEAHGLEAFRHTGAAGRAGGQHHARSACMARGSKGSIWAGCPLTPLVTDIVYMPLVTPLLADAQALGCARSMASACCCIRRCPASKPGSASNPR